MVAEIEGYFKKVQHNKSLEFELVPGDKGIFDVVVEGQMVYSKYQTGRFPNAAEVPQMF